MTWSVRSSLLTLGLALFGCASPAESQKPSAELAGYVLSEAPTDIEHPTLVNFGSAVELLGWDLSPADTARPGGSLHLKLYWRSLKKLTPGWFLFTHIVSADAPKPYAFDDVGPLRKSVPDAVHGTKPALSPSDWVPGSVYIDEQDITVPSEIGAPEVTLAVGLGREAVQVAGNQVKGLSGLRLEILSGLSDGQDRAIIARLATGVTPGQKTAPRGGRRNGSGRTAPKPAPKEKP
jgi:hypothetical protein